MKDVTPHMLEVFFHVAHAGGFTEAVGEMYGLQQPAISKQVAQLEARLGCSLCIRGERFALTREGRLLFLFLRPFFLGLPALLRRIRKRHGSLVRIAASEFILRVYLPAVLAKLRRLFPHVEVELRTASRHDIQSGLRTGLFDLGILTLDRPPGGVQHLALLELPLVGVVPVTSTIQSAEELRRHLTGPIVCPDRDDCITRHFLKGWRLGGATPPELFDVGTAALVPFFVAAQGRPGISLGFPRLYADAAVRCIALPGVTPVELAALSCPHPSPVVETLVELVMQEALRLKTEIGNGFRA